MLTRRQLARAAIREGVPLHTVERDYVEHLLLRQLPWEPFIFKGGTCLRIAWGSPRYSEDLDFNADLAAQEAEAVLSASVERLALYGVHGELRPRPSAKGNYSGVIRYAGPLFDGSDRSRGTVRLDVSLRGEAVEEEAVFVSRTPYPDVYQLALRSLSPPHLLAEKVRSLVVRQTPRDAYDIHFLLERGVRVDRSLLDRKMALYDRPYDPKEVRDAMLAVREAWAVDLEPLLGVVPPIDAVVKVVEEYLPGD